MKTFDGEEKTQEELYKEFIKLIGKEEEYNLWKFAILENKNEGK